MNRIGGRRGRLPTVPSGVGSIFYNITQDTVYFVRNDGSMRALGMSDTMTSNLQMTNGSGIITEYVDNPANTINIGNTASTVNIGAHSGVNTVNIGTGSGLTTINLGAPGDTVNIQGTLSTIDTTNTRITDNLITINANSVGSGTARLAGIQFRDNSHDNEGFIRTDSLGTGFELKAPESSGVVTLPASTSGEIAVKINDKITTSASVFAANELVPRSFVDGVEIDALTTNRAVSVITPNFPVNTADALVLGNSNSVLIGGNNINQNFGVVRFYVNNTIWHIALLGPNNTTWRQNFDVTTTNIQHSVNITANEVVVWQTDANNNIIVDSLGARIFSPIIGATIENYAISANNSELHIGFTLFNPHGMTTVRNRLGSTARLFSSMTFGSSTADSQVLVINYNIAVDNFVLGGWYHTTNNNYAKLVAEPNQNCAIPGTFAINYLNLSMHTPHRTTVLFSVSGSRNFSTGWMANGTFTNIRGLVLTSTNGVFVNAVTTTYPLGGFVPAANGGITVWGRNVTPNDMGSNVMVLLRNPIAVTDEVFSPIAILGFEIFIPIFYYSPTNTPSVTSLQMINIFSPNSLFLGGCTLADRFHALIISGASTINIRPVIVTVPVNAITMLAFNNIDLSGGVTVIPLGDANLTTLQPRMVKPIAHINNRIACVFTGIIGLSNWIINTSNPAATINTDSSSNWLMVWERISSTEIRLVAARRLPQTNTNHIAGLADSNIPQSVYRIMVSDLADTGLVSRAFWQNATPGDNLSNSVAFNTSNMQTPRIYFVNYSFVNAEVATVLPTGTTMWKRIMNRRGTAFNVTHPSITPVSIPDGSNLEFVARDNNTIIL